MLQFLLTKPVSSPLVVPAMHRLQASGQEFQADHDAEGWRARERERETAKKDMACSSDV